MLQVIFQLFIFFKIIRATKYLVTFLFRNALFLTRALIYVIFDVSFSSSVKLSIRKLTLLVEMPISAASRELQVMGSIEGDDLYTDDELQLPHPAPQPYLEYFSIFPEPF